MRYWVLLAIFNVAVLMMAGCGQKGALFLPQELPPEQPESEPVSNDEANSQSTL